MQIPRILPVLAAILIAAASAFAAEDLAALKARVGGAHNQIILELRQAKIGGQLDTAIALAVIQEHASPMFNFDALAKRAMGKHWRKADDSQRMEIRDLFRMLLERTYSRTLARFDGETVRIAELSEQADGSVALTMNVVKGAKSSRLDYLLEDDGSQWRIVDIKAEQISLLANYRRQFSQTVRAKGIDGLIAALRELISR